MAEIFVSGQIESASGFGDNQVSVRWKLSHGGGWRVVNGDTEGQTQADCPRVFEHAYFSHPIDLHFATNSIQGWPRILIQVSHHDNYGRQDVVGYGTIAIPSSCGTHQIRCGCWRPRGSWREEMMHRFIGGGMQLVNLNVLEDPEAVERIVSVSTGSVFFNLNIITRNFQKYGILS